MELTTCPDSSSPPGYERPGTRPRYPTPTLLCHFHALLQEPLLLFLQSHAGIRRRRQSPRLPATLSLLRHSFLWPLQPVLFVVELRSFTPQGSLSRVGTRRTHRILGLVQHAAFQARQLVARRRVHAHIALLDGFASCANHIVSFRNGQQRCAGRGLCVESVEDKHGRRLPEMA